jgi:pimeloyl-ACP methyl ester carboxylesterase
MAAVHSNGITIEYDVRGEGEPLLLVMGLGGQLTDWPEELLDRLVEAGFQVIRFDNRDAGLSTELAWEPPTVRALAAAVLARRRPPAGYLLNDMARDAAELLSALGHESAHVVGMSMGGMIAQAMAISHPSRVRSLTSIMSNTGDRRHGRPRRALLAKLARMPEPTRETAVDDAVTMFGLISGPTFDPVECRRVAEVSVARSWRPKGAARQTAAIFASPDRTAALRFVTAPTLVLHGLVDPLVMPSGGMATARAIPGSRLVMYPEMGHDLPRPRLAEIVAEITRNAERASRCSGSQPDVPMIPS